jgi:hypothetical protein
MRLAHRAAWSAAAVLVASSAFAQTSTRPAAPQVTVGADLKLLRFDWEPVPGATFYRLWIKTGDAGYSSVGERIPASTTHAQHSLAVHLQDWARTRYVVTACNDAGCTGSTPVNPQALMLATIGYFKASNADPEDLFGREVVVSDDGSTLAVTAEMEASSAQGANGDQSDNSSHGSGAVYIFRRSGTTWRQEAYLKPGVNFDGGRFGTGAPTLNQRAVALSGDGSVAVIGAPSLDTNAFGLSGEVYVFRRNAGSWSLTGTLRAPEIQTADFFGYSVDLSLDGQTLKINSRQPRSSPDGPYEGRTHLYRRDGSTFRYQTTIAPQYEGDACPIVRMSGDGHTLVASCISPESDTYRAVTYKRIGDTWVHVNDLPLTRFNDERPLALSYEGTRMALGLVSSSSTSVGVYRWTGTSWVPETQITSPEIGGTSSGFGQALSFDRAGQKLAVGAYSSSAGGAGVSRTVTAGSAQHGAVFVYERTTSTTTPWRLRSVVKASNPGQDLFGFSVSLSGSGRTLAVGAPREDSAARGIDGDQTNESATDSGAAYLY